MLAGVTHQCRYAFGDVTVAENTPIQGAGARPQVCGRERSHEASQILFHCNRTRPEKYRVPHDKSSSRGFLLLKLVGSVFQSHTGSRRAARHTAGRLFVGLGWHDFAKWIPVLGVVPVVRSRPRRQPVEVRRPNRTYQVCIH